MTKIDITAVPEISTPVALHASAQQREVTGAFCAGAVIAVIILVTGY